MKNQLIQIYLLVCQIYDSHSSLKYQRRSNFKPKFSDQEIITVYLFGQLNEKFNHRQIHQFIRDYWLDWFPDLPSYQAFNRRLNLLNDNFQALFNHLLQSLHINQTAQSLDYLIDSMPIMLACGTRSRRAKVAHEIAKCGFSATKQINFHGVRLHLIANKQTDRLPLPGQVWIKEGNVHDLVALKEITDELPKGINLFGDKAYVDESFKEQLKQHNVQLLTPIKKPKKADLADNQKDFNKAVSSIRQPIESFFKWLIDKTDIQRASQVRSTEGLLIHCLGKLTFALFLLNFYY
ncbi:IS982 family transposase [soil metagenome]